ncbi:hypothetical protein FRC12_002239 [Ceratobasidium sp. 428]|nr:hypothetical protein FRC12_002239 [Ceratobasidium sp. 428]
MGTLLSVPDEIIIRILLLVSAKDIQRYRRICRQLHEVVDSTAKLQYLVELDHLGYVEPTRPRRDLTYDQKAKLLREHRLRGASPSHTFTLETIFPSKRENTKHQNYTTLRDGVYVEGFGSQLGGSNRYLKLYQLPSWNRGTELNKWELRLAVDTVHVDLNFDLNLLCLVEEQGAGRNDPTVFHVHLRTLNSNDAHPRATFPKLSWRANQGSYSHICAWKMSSHIVGNLLGTLFSHRRSMMNYLIVWDWPSGSKLLHLDNMGYAPGSFTILDNKYVVSNRPIDMHGDPAVGYLDVYRLDGLDERPPPTVTLSLPLLESYNEHSRTYFHASPSSSIASTRLENSPYQPSPKLYEVGADTGHLCLLRSIYAGNGWLAIPSSTILDVVRECETKALPGATMISWELWGERTSWFYGGSEERPPSAALCSGLRTIVGAQPNRRDNRIFIHDFSSRAVQSSRRSTESGHEVVPGICFPREAELKALDQRSGRAPRVAELARHIFFRHEPLANQPFCTSRLGRRRDSELTMMQGEHIVDVIKQGKVIVFCF